MLELIAPRDFEGLILDKDSGIVENLKANHGVYVLLDRCGHVVERNGWLQCGAYYDPRRPEACDKFTMGGEQCIKIRESGGLIQVE